jgi:hypothetical protein
MSWLQKFLHGKTPETTPASPAPASPAPAARPSAAPPNVPPVLAWRPAVDVDIVFAR